MRCAWQPAEGDSVPLGQIGRKLHPLRPLVDAPYLVSKGNAIFEQKNQLYVYKTTSYKIVSIRIFRPMGTNIT